MVFPNFEDKNKKIISNNLVYGYLEKTNSLKSKLITKKHLSIKQNIFKLSKFDCTICKCYLWDSDSFLKHLTGKKHKRNILKFSKLKKKTNNLNVNYF
mmetsp:Transcript_2298/g.2870  ORF Transcript_2298/g.2870 Transcript_2298/m.2870 type:complete len:98 (-) Transcript_2298:480-773(-)